MTFAGSKNCVRKTACVTKMKTGFANVAQLIKKSAVSSVSITINHHQCIWERVMMLCDLLLAGQIEVKRLWSAGLMSCHFHRRKNYIKDSRERGPAKYIPRRGTVLLNILQDTDLQKLINTSTAEHGNCMSN